MAELLLSVERHLDAGHQLPDVDNCKHEHGHRFVVTVTLRATIDARRGSLPDIYDVGDELDLVLGELIGKNLNKMMVGAAPTGPNFAAWVLERITVKYPKVVEVAVATDPSHRYVLRREVRM